MSLENVELSLMLLVFLVGVLALLARRLQTPYPIVLVIGGSLLSLFPHVPQFTLNPDLVFLVILPPLLFAAGYYTSWPDFRFNLVSILMLAFGLVAFTVVGSAAVTRWFLPGFDWRSGLVLGAVVATTDAIAATSIARRLGLPRQLVAVIEGESLVNDATGLLALQFTVAMITKNHIPTVTEGALQLIWLVIGGTAVGLTVGWIFAMVQTRVSDVQIQIILSLVAPYAAYLLSERLHASGVLSVVVAGILFGRRSSTSLTSSARINATAVWDTLEFAFNGFVFILIGLQLPQILDGIRGMSRGALLRDGVLFSAVVIALRILWVFPGAYVAYFIRRRIFKQQEATPSLGAIFIVSWTGMRGVLALAAAFALPVTRADGTPFVQRNVILLFTFCVIFITLVLQGLTLPVFIRKLGLARSGGDHEEEIVAREEVLETALARLKEMRPSQSQEEQKVLADLMRIYRRRLMALKGQAAHADDNEGATRWRHYRKLVSEARDVERQAITKLRAANKVSEGTLRRLERELDLLDLRQREEEA